MNTNANQNYEEITSAIVHRQPFSHCGGNMTGVRKETDYQIYSYSTLIYAENFRTGEVWINPAKYSMTTSRQLNIVKRALRLA